MTVTKVEWMGNGACTRTGPDVFFPREGQSRAERAADIERARTICQQCDVQDECLEFALETASRSFEGTGVWGGLTEDERRELRRRRSARGVA